MKTKEELNQLKMKYESLKDELKTLTDDELNMVVGGKSPHLIKADSGNDAEGCESGISKLEQSTSCKPKTGTSGERNDAGVLITYLRCSDKPNQGKKPACATCSARDSIY